MKKINNLIESDIYDKYIFTTFKNRKNSLYETKLNWKKFNSIKDQKIAVNIPKNSIIFEKYGYGISDKDLMILKENKTKEIDICGVYLDACVYAITLQLFDNGIFPNILLNYTETSHATNKNNMKKILVHQFSKVDKKL